MEHRFGRVNRCDIGQEPRMRPIESRRAMEWRGLRPIIKGHQSATECRGRVASAAGVFGATQARNRGALPTYIRKLWFSGTEVALRAAMRVGRTLHGNRGVHRFSGCGLNAGWSPAIPGTGAPFRLSVLHRFCRFDRWGNRAKERLALSLSTRSNRNPRMNSSDFKSTLSNGFPAGSRRHLEVRSSPRKLLRMKPPAATRTGAQAQRRLSPPIFFGFAPDCRSRVLYLD